MMRSAIRRFPVFLSLALLAGSSFGQLDQICGESGGTAWLSSPIVYGKVGLHGFPKDTKLPKITITLYDRNRTESRFTLDRTGNYCFRDIDGSGGFVVVDIEGVEIARRTLQTLQHIKQHRQDFDLYDTRANPLRPPGSISAKHHYPRNEKNNELFENALEAERAGKPGTAAKFLKEIVTNDPKDFGAWLKLGAVYFEQRDLDGAEKAFKQALAAKPDYGPAMMSLGRTYLVQAKPDAAIESLLKSTETDPSVARGFQLLGEAYLLARKGTLGVEALNEAIRLDPVGMAECHLLMAHLYDRAGVKAYAAREYKLFLEKVREHPDRKKFEKYVKDNPEAPGQD
jgi:predicted negative regulator of RcsB-dependent stress response